MRKPSQQRVGEGRQARRMGAMTTDMAEDQKRADDEVARLEDLVSATIAVLPRDYVPDTAASDFGGATRTRTVWRRFYCLAALPTRHVVSYRILTRRESVFDENVPQLILGSAPD